MPRALFIDLEPNVIQQLTRDRPLLYNPDNLFDGIVGEMGGAGNVWASGYNLGNEHSQIFMDMLSREVGFADNLSSLSMTHSIAGGTGSGLGSLLLEKIHDEFPKTPVHAFSVFPHRTASDTILQPYNSLLALSHLTQYTDGVTVFDNEAISELNTSSDRRSNNVAIGHHMTLLTTPQRFPSWGPGADMASMFSLLAPMPRMHFMVPSLAPMPTLKPKGSRITSAGMVLRHLLAPENALVALQQEPTSRMISAIALIQGSSKPAELAQALTSIKLDKHCPIPVTWCPGTIIPYHVPASPFVTPRAKTVGALVTNTTGIRHLFGSFLNEHNKMIATRAHLHHFTKHTSEEDALARFTEAKETMTSLCKEYEAAEGDNYLSYMQ